MKTTMKGLLFITHRTDRFDYLQSAMVALEGGCRLIQLRMKGSPITEMRNTAVELKKICAKYDAQLFINDMVELCDEISASGVHLGRNDMPVSSARKILGQKYMIGGTANNMQDIRSLQKENADYIGLGPYRFTTTKQNLSPILGINGYENILNQCRSEGINIPIFAIGGIKKEDIPMLMKSGVSGIAVASTILEAADPIMETKEIINLINSSQQ